MDQLLEKLLRYSKVSNIPLPIKDNCLDLQEFFMEAFNRGYLTDDIFNEICSILN